EKYFIFKILINNSFYFALGDQMERKKPIIRTAKAGDLPTREQIIENDKKLVEYMKENGDWEEFKKVMKNLAKM
ncbi:hypothetical protein C4M80_04240, partial [Mycoplasmopsis pullorum]